MQDRRKTLWLIVGLLSAFVFVLSVGCLGLALVTPLVTPDTTDDQSLVLIASGAVVVIGLGVALGIVSFRAWKERSSPLFYWRRGWVVLLVAWVVLGALGFLLYDVLLATPLFVFLHVVLILLPALVLLLLATLTAGRAAALTLRRLVVGLSGGMLAVLPAVPVEGIGLVVSGLVVFGLGSLFPAGQAEVERLMREVERLSMMDPTAVAPEDILALASSPLVIAVLLITLAIITPIIEELAKSLIAAVATRRQPMSLQRAFLWGAAAGAGFAILEGVFNGGLGLAEDVGWLSGIAMRIPATAMHAVTTGIIGVGWGLFWQRRRRWLLPLSYLTSIFYHGLWNFSTIGLLGGGTLAVSPEVLLQGLGSVLTLLLGGILLVMMLLAPVSLVVFPGWLRRRAEKTLQA
jgi:hypothetical protein